LRSVAAVALVAFEHFFGRCASVGLVRDILRRRWIRGRLVHCCISDDSRHIIRFGAACIAASALTIDSSDREVRVKV
jgi:hypothetical protein